MPDDFFKREFSRKFPNVKLLLVVDSTRSTKYVNSMSIVLSDSLCPHHNRQSNKS